jgi:putative ABC transport system permease protein
MDTILEDLRYALRMLAKSPGFALAAILTLAVGIGANTAVFAVLDAALLKPLPIPQPDRVVRIGAQHPQAFVYFNRTGFSTYPAFQRSKAFTAVGAYVSGEITFGRGGGRRRAAAVTPAFFDVLGVRPLMGRTFTAEDLDGSAHIAVISHRVWQSQFNGARDVLSRSVVLNGETFLVIGVMPPAMSLPDSSDVWVTSNWGPRIIGDAMIAPVVIARLAEGISRAHALDEVLRTPSRTLERRGIVNAPPGTFPGAEVVPLRSALVEDHASILLFVGAGALLVLVVACINLANLALARLSARRRELAVRRALGASNRDLARQVLCESALLVVAGAIATLFVSNWTVDIVRALVPVEVYGATDIGIDRRTLFAITGLSALAAVLFSAGPLWSTRNSFFTDTLRVAAVATVDPVWRRLRSALAVSEIAVAVVLLAGAVTVVRTVASLVSADLGVRTERALALKVDLPREAYASSDRSRQYFEQLESAIRAVPGVETVAVASALPGRIGVADRAELIVDGAPVPAGGKYVGRGVIATPAYFPAMGINLVAGRLFGNSDGFYSQKVAIVSESFARRYSLRPDQIVGRAAVLDHRNVQIVGVVRDVRYSGPEKDFDAAAYVPMAQRLPGHSMHVLVKTARDPRSLAASVRAAGARVDPGVPLYDIQTFDDIRETYIQDRRFVMRMMSGFGGLSIVLAVLGLYGVIAYLVQLRTREIGVRMTLGASTWSVRLDVLRSGLRHAAAGIAVGVGASVALSLLVGSAFERFGALDLLTVAAVSGATLGIAVVATWFPARRATRIDPVVALRYE